MRVILAPCTNKQNEDKQVQSCSSKQFAQKGACEHKLRDKNMPLQENPNDNAEAWSAAQHTSGTNKSSSAQQQQGHGWSSESQESKKDEEKRYLAGKVIEFYWEEEKPLKQEW